MNHNSDGECNQVRKPPVVTHSMSDPSIAVAELPDWKADIKPLKTPPCFMRRNLTD